MPTYLTPSHDSSDNESNFISSQQHHENSIPLPKTRSESGSSSQNSFFEAREMSQNLGDFVPNPTDSRLTLENTVTIDPQASNELKFAAQELQNAAHYIQEAEERARKAEINAEELREALQNLTTKMQTNPQNSQTQSVREISKRSTMKWAEWNGNTENFASWIQHNRSKLRNDVGSLPDNEGICSEIVATIPDFKRPRVLEWHKTGGPDRSWDPHAFLDHIKLRFEDKESRKKSAQRLSKLRQGKYQCFAEYLQDFEVLLGKAEGMGWPDYLKINTLEESLNSKFKSCVVPLALPENYDAWVTEVTRIANRYEAMTDWCPRNAKADDKQSYFTGEERVNKVDVRTLAQEERPVVDGEGDTIMSGINKIQALIASLQNVKSNDRHRPKRYLPPAPWRSKEEFEKLRQDGKCVRCCQTGHAWRECPSFGRANRPSRSSMVNNIELNYDDTDSKNSESEKE